MTRRSMAMTIPMWAGYLTPIASDDPDYRFDGTLENLPDGWRWKIAMVH